jgi:hypothetical protein
MSWTRTSEPSFFGWFGVLDIYGGGVLGKAWVRRVLLGPIPSTSAKAHTGRKKSKEARQRVRGSWASKSMLG